MKKVIIYGVSAGFLFLFGYIIIFEMFYENEKQLDYFMFILLFVIILVIQFTTKNKNTNGVSTFPYLYKTGVIFSVFLGITLAIGFAFYLYLINPAIAEKINNEFINGVKSATEDNLLNNRIKEKISFFSTRVIYIISCLNYIIWGCFFSLIGAFIFKNKPAESKS